MGSVFPEATLLIDVFKELFQKTTILELTGLEQSILQVALSKGISSCNASYVALTSRYNPVLVIEELETIA